MFEAKNIMRFSVPAFPQACVHNRDSAWIHTFDALQAWHR